MATHIKPNAYGGDDDGRLNNPTEIVQKYLSKLEDDPESFDQIVSEIKNSYPFGTTFSEKELQVVLDIIQAKLKQIQAYYITNTKVLKALKKSFKEELKTLLHTPNTINPGIEGIVNTQPKPHTVKSQEKFSEFPTSSSNKIILSTSTIELFNRVKYSLLKDGERNEEREWPTQQS